MQSPFNTWPLGLTGLYSERGDKLTMQEVEDRVTDWLKKLETEEPGLLALIYQTANRRGLTLADCPSRIAAFRAKLKP